MTTNELKALLTEVAAYLRESSWGHSLIPKDCEKCAWADKIDAALSSDFAVVPREPTMQIEAAYFLALDHYGTKNHYPVYKAMLAAAEGK